MDLQFAKSKHESGLILIAGTNGRGKSATLADVLHHLEEYPAPKIHTVEEPVEYVIAGVELKESA